MADVGGVAIAKPLAPKKLNKKVLKTVKKASKAKHVKLKLGGE